MAIHRNSKLLHVASILGLASVALLAAALLTLGLAIWHVSQAGYYGPSYLITPMWLTASALLFTLAIFITSAWVLRLARATAFARAAQLSSGAMLATIAAWAAFGATFFVLTHDWYAA